MADKKGFYRKRGLDVTILHGGPDVDPLANLAKEKADFVTAFLPPALASRDRGVPVVHLAQIVNRSNLMILAWKNKGIRELKDLDGRDIRIWDDMRVGYDTFFKAFRIDPKPCSHYYSLDMFLRRGLDACAAMHYNEYHRIYQAGIDLEELTVFSLHDFGCGFPEDGIYCLESTLSKSPKVCRAFTEGSMEGWEYAREHPSEALDVVMALAWQAHMPTNRAHMQWMLEKILASVFPSPKDTWKFGQLSPPDYTRTVEAMRSLQQLKKGVPFEQFVKSTIQEAK